MARLRTACITAPPQPDDGLRISVMSRLAMRLLRQNVTLLCAKAEPQRCHRRLVAEACRQFNSSLVIELA